MYKRYPMVLLALCMAFCLGIYPAMAETFTCCLADVKGDWKIDYETDDYYLKHYAMTPMESQAFWTSMRQVVETFQKTSMLNPPMGIMMRGNAGAYQYGSFFTKDEAGDYKDRRVPGDIFLKFIELRRGSDGKLLEYKGGDETHPQLHIQTNLPDAISSYSGFGYERIYDNQGREIFYQPIETGRFSGYPVYDNRVLVIHDKNKPLFIPVTREQYINAYIYWTEYQDKQANKEGQNGFFTDALRKELQEMAPEEKSKPAYVNIGRMGDTFRYSFLVDPETEEDRALVMFNPNYFDNFRPRTEVQLITLDFLRDYPVSLEEPFGTEVLDTGYHIDSVCFSQLMHSMDYTTLSKLLPPSAAASQTTSTIGSSSGGPYDGSINQPAAIPVKPGDTDDKHEGVQGDKEDGETKTPEIYTNKNGYLGEGDNDFKIGEYLGRPKWMPTWFPIDKNANITMYLKQPDEYSLTITFIVDKELTVVLKEYQNTFKYEAGYKSTVAKDGSNINFKTAGDSEEWNINFYDRGSQETEIAVSGVGCPR